ncbi:MAG: hypothetical protein HKN32_04615, partial [Flavobacteriales bacterium]|nr:hypothetical protein [Flavobacteriales bacterium]
MTDQVPPGLEYKEEYWDSALVMIERHEKKMVFYRIAGAAGVVGVILLLLTSGHFFWQTPGLDLDRYADNREFEYSRNFSGNHESFTAQSEVFDPTRLNVFEDEGVKASPSVEQRTSTGLMAQGSVNFSSSEDSERSQPDAKNLMVEPEEGASSMDSPAPNSSKQLNTHINSQTLAITTPQTNENINPHDPLPGSL